MPIVVSWGNSEKTVVESAFNEAWTLEDGHNMIDEIHAMTSSVDHTVHVIMDFTRSQSSPAKMLSAGNHIEKRASANSGLSIIVKANAFMKAITQLIMKMFVSNGKLYFVDTLDEAYEIIADYEQTRVKS